MSKGCPPLSWQVSAVDSLEGPLLQVEGLSDLRLELHSKKMNLHLVLIDELHRHLYIKSTNRVGQRAKDRARLGWDSPPRPQPRTWPRHSSLHPELAFLAGKSLRAVAVESTKLRFVDAPSSLFAFFCFSLLLGFCCFPQLLCAFFPFPANITVMRLRAGKNCSF